MSVRGINATYLSKCVISCNAISFYLLFYFAQFILFAHCYIVSVVFESAVFIDSVKFFKIFGQYSFLRVSASAGDQSDRLFRIGIFWSGF